MNADITWNTTADFSEFYPALFLQVVINEKNAAYNIDLSTDMHSSLTVTCLWPPQHQDAYTPVVLSFAKSHRFYLIDVLPKSP